MPFHCKLCDVEFKTQKQCDTHMNTNKHIRNLEKEQRSAFMKDRLISLKDFERIFETYKEEQEMKFQKLKKDFEKLEMNNEKMRRQLVNFRKLNVKNAINSFNDNSINNSNVNVEVVQIRPLGNEELTYITDNLAMRLMAGPNAFAAKAMHYVHFNKNHPENHNIMLQNKSMDVVQIHDGKNFNSKKRKEALEAIVLSLFNNFEEKFGEKFRSKYSEKHFCKRWVNKIFALTEDTNQKNFDEVLKREASRIELPLIDMSDRLKRDKCREYHKNKARNEEKQKLYVKVYADEMNRRTKIDDEIIEEGQDIDDFVWEEDIERYCSDIVEETFDETSFNTKYIEPSDNDPSFMGKYRQFVI